MEDYEFWIKIKDFVAILFFFGLKNACKLFYFSRLNLFKMFYLSSCTTYTIIVFIFVKGPLALLKLTMKTFALINKFYLHLSALFLDSSTFVYRRWLFLKIFIRISWKYLPFHFIFECKIITWKIITRKLGQIKNNFRRRVEFIKLFT